MITREVEASAVADLALAPPRVALAVTVDDEIHLLPINSSVERPGDLASSARLVRVPREAPNLADRNVVIVADDGPQWFRLRSLTVRGTAAATGDRSYRVVPTRVVAWDYGSLRDLPTPPETPRPRPPLFTGADHRDSRPLRSPNLEAALAKSRVMVFATRSRKGTPFAVPLWFVPHRGHLYATTAASSWTIRNLAYCSQAALLLGGEGAHDNGRLLVRGSARAVPGFPPGAVLAQLAWRYYLHPRFAAVELSHLQLWARRMRYYGQSQPGYVVITPQSATECRTP